AADPDADDRRRAGLAPRLQHAIDDEGLDRVDALGRYRHAQPRVVLGARALGDHLERQRARLVGEVDVDDRHAASARGLLVLAGGRMHDRGAEGVLARRALAAAPDRLLERPAVHLDAAPDAQVVDREAGVLAEEVVGLLGHGDVADHGAEHAPGARVRFSRLQPREPLLDVGRQPLQGPDIELLGGFLDDGRIDLHFTEILRSFTTFAQRAVSSLSSRASSSGVFPTGARPWA